MPKDVLDTDLTGWIGRIMPRGIDVVAGLLTIVCTLEAIGLMLGGLLALVSESALYFAASCAASLLFCGTLLVIVNAVDRIEIALKKLADPSLETAEQKRRRELQEQIAAEDDAAEQEARRVEKQLRRKLDGGK